MRKIQILITFFERIFAWGHQNHPDPHCRCHSHPQAPICLCIFPTLLVPRARNVACETADKQTTCSRPRGAACVRKKAFFLLERWIEQRPSLSKAKSLSAQSFSAAKAMSRLSALDMSGVTDRAPSWKPFCLIETESSVKASWFRTSGRYAVHCCLHALTDNIASHIDPLHVGAVRWDGVCNLTLSCRLRSSSERRIETKFSLQLKTLDVCITGHFPLFYLQAASKTQAFDAGDTLWRPSSSWVDFETRSLLLFVANPRGLKLNYTHWYWASKSTWGWLHLFSQTARLVSHPSKPRAVVVRGSSSDRDRRHGNWSSSCLEVPTPMSRSKWPFRAMRNAIEIFWSRPSFGDVASAASHDIGGRNAIESFFKSTKLGRCCEWR